jgi:hypothetical protein
VKGGVIVHAWPILLAALALLPAVDGPADARGPASAEKDAWAVALHVPAHARPGEPSRATVRLQARAGYHVNGEYPTSFQPDPAAAGTLGSKKLMLTERVATTACPSEPGQACDVTFALPFTLPAAGDAVLAGTLSFSVCTADRCLIEKARLSAPVPVG